MAENNDRIAAEQARAAKEKELEKQQLELVKRICSSEELKRAPVSQRLMKFLWDNRRRILDSAIIEVEFYEWDGKTKFNAGHSRQQVGELRKFLYAYRQNHPDEQLICEIPDETFNLLFSKPGDFSLTESFWAPHWTGTKETVVIGGWRLFFFDPSENRVFRYYDFNEKEGNDQKLREKLRQAHPDAVKDSSLWDTLLPQRDFYLAAGDIHAFEKIQKWFFEKNGVLLKREISRERQLDKIQEISPILLGRPITNKFIRHYVGEFFPSSMHMRFGDSLGSVIVKEVTPKEDARLRGSYDVSDSGVISPGPEWESAFGIVSRFPHPGGKGTVTIISADFHSQVISRIVQALTVEKDARDLLARTSWATSGFPERFEMLISVPLSPAGMGGEGDPKVILAR